MTGGDDDVLLYAWVSLYLLLVILWLHSAALFLIGCRRLRRERLCLVFVVDRRRRA